MKKTKVTKKVTPKVNKNVLPEQPEPSLLHVLIELQYIKCNLYIAAKAIILAALIKNNPNTPIEGLIDDSTKAVDLIQVQQTQQSRA